MGPAARGGQVVVGGRACSSSAPKETTAGRGLGGDAAERPGAVKRRKRQNPPPPHSPPTPPTTTPPTHPPTHTHESGLHTAKKTETTPEHGPEGRLELGHPLKPLLADRQVVPVALQQLALVRVDVLVAPFALCTRMWWVGVGGGGGAEVLRQGGAAWRRAVHSAPKACRGERSACR